MRCPHCQHENHEGAHFCAACGRSLASRCPNCGHQPPPGATFCDHCGTQLTGQGSAIPPSSLMPHPQPPHAYTPQHLAEKILTSKTALEGERKQVTVLFADLKGSMELLADRDPEDARAILDPVLTLMMDAVHRYEGTVNQVMEVGAEGRRDHWSHTLYLCLSMESLLRALEAFSMLGNRQDILLENHLLGRDGQTTSASPRRYTGSNGPGLCRE
jgi:Double zinc ribbon